VPSIEGFLIGDDRQDALRKQQRLTSLGRRSRGPVTATFDDELGATSREVSVRSIAVGDIGKNLVVDFAIDMLAPDPLRYGPVVEAATGLPQSGGGLQFPLGVNPARFFDFGAVADPGRVTVTNEGEESTYSMLEVRGGLPSGFLLTEVETAREIRFDRAVPPRSTVYLNPRTGSATIDNQSDVSGYLTTAEWFEIPAGESRQIQFTSLGGFSESPRLRALTRSAYF
jgi:hypothetical protein